MDTEETTPDAADVPRKKMGTARKILLGTGLALVTALAAGGIAVGVTYANGGPQALLGIVADLPLPDSALEPAFTQVVSAAGGEYTAGKSESDVIAEARALCKRLDGGESIPDVAASASTGVNDLQGFGTVMGTGIVMFCPSHEPEMMQYLSSIGQGAQAP
ncbi:MAG TPA: DUF732 domain-containing protein [Arthrobacter sp.]